MSPGIGRQEEQGCWRGLGELPLKAVTLVPTRAPFLQGLWFFVCFILPTLSASFTATLLPFDRWGN